MRSIPSEDETFSRLGSLKGLWYESLYSAILDTSKHYKMNPDHRRDQPQLFSLHVRSKFLTLLEPQAEANNFSIVRLQSSFLVTSGFFACKFRKAFDGGVPLPLTKTQLKFYNANYDLCMQATLPGLEAMRTFSRGNTVNLIVYYDITPDDELAWVKIACPRFATMSRVETEWDKPLENPLFGGDESLHVKHVVKKRKDLSYPLLEDDDTSTELTE